MSELAKKAAAIARAKRAKFICKASRWEGPLEEMSLPEIIEQFGKNSVGGQAFSRHSATAPGAARGLLARIFNSPIVDFRVASAGRGKSDLTYERLQCPVRGRLRHRALVAG